MLGKVYLRESLLAYKGIEMNTSFKLVNVYFFESM